MEASSIKPRTPGLGARLDRVGVAASLACAVHCAVLPFAIALLPVWGLGFLAGHSAEWGLLLLAATLGVASLGLGYRKHRSIRTLALLTGALALLTLGRFADQRAWAVHGALFGVAGGLTLMTAHWLNYRLCRACKTCKTHEGC